MKLASLIRYAQYKKNSYVIIVNTDDYIGTDLIIVKKSIVEDLDKCIAIVNKAISLQGVTRRFFTDNNDISNMLNSLASKCNKPLDGGWLSDGYDSRMTGQTIVNKSNTIVTKQIIYDKHKLLFSNY